MIINLGWVTHFSFRNKSQSKKKTSKDEGRNSGSPNAVAL